MHFCVSATRGGFHCGFCWPRKIGTNWFMPAFVKSRFGASGRSDDDGTMVCFFSRKKSRKDCRVSAEVMVTTNKHEFEEAETATQNWRQSTYSLQRELALVFVELRFNGGLDLVVKRLVVLQNFFRDVAALSKLRPFVIQPGTPLLDDLFFQRHVEKRAG